MINPASSGTPSTVQILGWTLVHFIWEGVALAAILYVALAFCRTALARYSAALGTLVLMVCCPLATSFFLAHRAESAFHVASLPRVAGAANAALTAHATTPRSTAVLPFESPGWLTWFVLFWCAGVLVFAMRASAAGLCSSGSDVRRHTNSQRVSANVAWLCSAVWASRERFDTSNRNTSIPRL
jgi:hypothetical protein